MHCLDNSSLELLNESIYIYMCIYTHTHTYVWTCFLLSQMFNGMIDLKSNSKVVFTICKSNVTVWVLLVDETVLKTKTSSDDPT